MFKRLKIALVRTPLLFKFEEIRKCMQIWYLILNRCCPKICKCPTLHFGFEETGMHLGEKLVQSSLNATMKVVSVQLEKWICDGVQLFRRAVTRKISTVLKMTCSIESSWNWNLIIGKKLVRQLGAFSLKLIGNYKNRLNARHASTNKLMLLKNLMNSNESK